MAKGGQQPSLQLKCLAFILAIGIASADLITTRDACCGLLIMDSTNRVLLDEYYRITPGSYFSMSVFFCSVDSIYVQIWRELPATNSERFSLVYQQLVVPDQKQLGKYVEYELDEPWIINEDGFNYILGLFSIPYIDPTNPLRDQKIGIPYTFGDGFGLFTSKESYLDKELQKATSIEKETLLWPRTFKNFVVFCGVTGCTLAADDPLGNPTDSPNNGGTSSGGSNSGGSTSGGSNNGGSGGVTTPQGPDTSYPQCCDEPGPPGPPGPQGEQGPPGPPGSFDPIDGISCDVPDSVTNGINSQSSKINEMDEKIDKIDALLRGLTDSNIVTGLCPTGFISATYGVGSCYIVYKEMQQMGQAVLNCRDNHAATIVSIETELEENFIKSLVANVTGLRGGTSLEEYWTAGMYNTNARVWVWYDENTRTKKVMNYRNWKEGTEPIPNSDDDVCMTFVLDYPNNQDYWINKNCNQVAYYICEIPKSCL